CKTACSATLKDRRGARLAGANARLAGTNARLAGANARLAGANHRLGVPTAIE
ncbi:MAG: hypothetical protein HXK22_04665, partial [Alloprevotella tannerae]|nr:hypothetical protein [Alloprevotella tannerae]